MYRKGVKRDDPILRLLYDLSHSQCLRHRPKIDVLDSETGPLSQVNHTPELTERGLVSQRTSLFGHRGESRDVETSDET